MNRAFKTQYHGSLTDLKTIVTMGVTVNNGKRFRSLSKEDRNSLVDSLNNFISQVKAFTKEVKENKYGK